MTTTEPDPASPGRSHRPHRLVRREREHGRTSDPAGKIECGTTSKEKIGLNETSGGSRLSYLLKAGTPSLFNRAATSAPALCVLTLLSM